MIELQTNEKLACHILEQIVRIGVTEFCLCPGSRNAPFVMALTRNPLAKKYFWYEERSGAFFALGRSRAKRSPVAIITTSGTAAAETLPAVIEAHYTGVPLLIITADRPRRFRGTGAPQSIEQVGLFGKYLQFEQDVAEGDSCLIQNWNLQGPAHLNVCLEEPARTWKEEEWSWSPPSSPPEQKIRPVTSLADQAGKVILDQFLKDVSHPLVVVSTLNPEARDAVAEFLVWLNAPAILEGISGLREDERLRHLRITRTEKIWQHAEKAGYPIDGVLRIGAVPTTRVWRDLEDRQGQLKVCSIHDLPFSGLSWGGIIALPLVRFFTGYRPCKMVPFGATEKWLSDDREYAEKLAQLCREEPKAEASFFYQLSQLLPEQSHIYLGNSLPIRQWDLAASGHERRFQITASRGANGIDGQISTFLGLSQKGCENWGLFGDLTALYDMAAPWILPQLPDHQVTIVVVNNGGGQIASRMYPTEKEFLHEHTHSFQPLAQMWGLLYEKWLTPPPLLQATREKRLIEWVPDEQSTKRFWEKYDKL